MSDDELVAQLLSALEQRGAIEAIALADLLRLEQHLTDSLRILRRLLDATIRKTASEERP